MNAPNLPIAIVQISRVVGWEAGVQTYWNAVQEAQRKLPDLLDHCTITPAIDLPLDDVIHIGGEGTNRLGKRLADAMWSMTGGKTNPPIALKSVSLQTDFRTKAGQIIVEFENVKGALHASGNRAVGFALVDAQSRVREAIYHTDLEGNRAILNLSIPAAHVQESFLHYGFGLDPICNITDQADRSIPVFGPVSLGEAK